jgi:hypothetical protein
MVAEEPTTRTYAAFWAEPGGEVARGSLELGPGGIFLRGVGSYGAEVVEEVPFSELASVTIARHPDERLLGRPTLLLERRSAGPLRIGTIGAGLLWELADLLTQLVDRDADRSEQIVVAAPLKPGAVERARALIADGPHFDPRASGLTRHEVLVTDETAIFVFEGRDLHKVVERLMQEPGLWIAALDWDECFSATPQLAHAVYTWTAEPEAK